MTLLSAKELLLRLLRLRPSGATRDRGREEARNAAAGIQGPAAPSEGGLDPAPGAALNPSPASSAMPMPV